MPSQREKGSAFIKRILWFNIQIETVINFPKYKATACTGEINTSPIHPQSIAVESGIAIRLDNKNNNGN